jgi:putative DNA primase/helicase
MRDDTRSRARGRWRSILTAFGVPERLVDGKHHPCPFCGGKDRFRFTDYQGSGGYICNQCGTGSGFDLLMKIKGWDFKMAAGEIDRIIGSCGADVVRPEHTEQEKQEAIRRLWDSASPITLHDAAGRYLRSRCRVTEFPKDLRFAPSLSCTGQAARYPGMVAKVTAPDGSLANVHRTYLAGAGAKAAIENPRRLMPGPIAKGAAVRLAAHGSCLGIAEGVETALSAMALTQTPCWAALNAAMLQSWVPPVGVETVTIYADNDENYVGQEAAYALARRLQHEGRHTTVRVPSTPGADFNDVHLELEYDDMGAVGDTRRTLSPVRR